MCVSVSLCVCVGAKTGDKKFKRLQSARPDQKNLSPLLKGKGYTRVIEGGGGGGGGE